MAGVIAVALGALLFAGALADDGHPVWVGLVFGPLCAALGWVAVGGLVERVRARLEPDQAALLTAYADVAALLLAAIAVFVPPLALLAIPAFVVLLLGGRRREGREVRRAEDPAVVPKKLVLAVIDSLKPDMLDQAVAEGQAPALASLLELRHLHPRLHLDLPVGHPGGVGGDRDGMRPGRASHPFDELVPPR